MAVREPGVRSPEARRQRMLARMHRPWWKRHGELLRYALAFVSYVALGLVAEEVFSSWMIGVLFLVASVWGIPALWRRLR